MTGKYVTERLRADDPGIARAAAILRAGGLVAVPTETVYGLAARADDPAAVARIYDAKGRPGHNPLIVHVASTAEAHTFATLSPAAERLAAEFWPGPLTMVLPRRGDAGLAPAVSADLATVALRVPAHPAMRAVLAQSGVALAAPSANRSGWISPTSADHVLASLDGRIDAVLDGGDCPRGLESTIVAVRADGALEVLRPGPVEVVAAPVAPASRGAIEAPGQLASHYAPGKPVRLDAREAAADEFLIGFGAVAGECSLSPSGDLGEAASRLYACLHLAARSPKPRIAVAPVPMSSPVSGEGIGAAIADRLRRAATPP